MRNRSVSVLLLILTLSVACGCGKRVQQPTATSQKPLATGNKSNAKSFAQRPPLPDWAPKNPSPEFLRAAKVLRGVPMDTVGRGDLPQQSWRALLAYMGQVNPTLWQLFGSLSEMQIRRFLASEKITVRVRDLTARQRTALDGVLDANKNSPIQISGTTLPDFRTGLYKMGAKQDLSNVTIGFTIEGANTLSFNARVRGVKDSLIWTGWAQAPRVGPTSATSRQRIVKSPPLPDWAPKDPSPEFLRAANALKPSPPEDTSAEAAASEPGLAAITQRIRSTWPACYEFFGSLSDKQINRFMTTREVRIPIKELTKPQRAALDNWFKIYRGAMKGATPSLPIPTDYLVELYKQGAKENLSNVDVGFATVPFGSSSSAPVSTHRVQIWFWVRREGGGVEQVGYAFAQI